MWRPVAGRVLVVLLSTGLLAVTTGCSTNLPGELFGGKQGRAEDELLKEPKGTVPPSDAAVTVSPSTGHERQGAATQTPGGVGGPDTAGEDYRVMFSFSDLGVVEIVLEGEGATQQAWRSADAEAQNRCRAWGYEKAAGNPPVHKVRLYRCQNKASLQAAGNGGQAKPVLWRTEDFRRVLWNFRSRAEQGDERALKIVHGLAAQQGSLERRAERGGAKAWTAWMFSVVMASDAEVQADAWRCLPRGERRGDEREVMLGRLSEAGSDVGVGEVSAFGASHPAVFRALGPDLRWEFGRGSWRDLPHAFVIEADGSGYRYNVSSLRNGQAESKQHFDCKRMG